MIKCLIVSDTHGNRDVLEQLFFRYQYCDYFFHLGDFQLPDDFLYPFTAVRGNCDSHSTLPLQRTIVTPFGKILLSHHPLQKESLPPDVRLFLHGHTHIKEWTPLKDGQIIACPGSAILPRDDEKGSFLLVDIDQDRISHEFCEYPE